MNDLITTHEFADIARCPDSTARYWRHIGYGPKGFRVGRRVLYKRAEVARWLESLSNDEERDASAGGAACS